MQMHRLLVNRHHPPIKYIFVLKHIFVLKYIIVLNYITTQNL